MSASTARLYYMSQFRRSSTQALAHPPHVEWKLGAEKCYAAFLSHYKEEAWPAGGSALNTLFEDTAHLPAWLSKRSRLLLYRAQPQLGSQEEVLTAFNHQAPSTILTHATLMHMPRLSHRPCCPTSRQRSRTPRRWG